MAVVNGGMRMEGGFPRQHCKNRIVQASQPDSKFTSNLDECEGREKVGWMESG